MISVSGKKWEQKTIAQNLVDKLKQDFNFSDILCRLIISRKFDDDEIATINTDLNLNNQQLICSMSNQMHSMRVLGYGMMALLIQRTPVQYSALLWLLPSINPPKKRALACSACNLRCQHEPITTVVSI